jgi:hypothetical protein
MGRWAVQHFAGSFNENGEPVEGARRSKFGSVTCVLHVTLVGSIALGCAHAKRRQVWRI